MVQVGLHLKQRSRLPAHDYQPLSFAVCICEPSPNPSSRVAAQLTTLHALCITDVHWDTSKSLDQLLHLRSKPRHIVMYVSNIAYFVGRTAWSAQVRSWATELGETATDLQILHMIKFPESKRSTAEFSAHISPSEVRYPHIVTGNVTEVFTG